ncbi:DUF3263 domain-containing protein [Pimelobacter simplex]|uniref:DUF3263 domain-containing protein n=1 Tax=Nocardioides simplex TaxID=2045 RepID=A0A7J5DSK1_NOCSI|nr:DUF3263 domain-containing protein [Pimelobacter simplex]KAB2807969.1 DUF3263 domain-containing protein [Pimelobacter simplex]
MAELSERERAMLEFERQWWRYPAAKESAIHEQFGMSAVLYYRSLHQLVDRPEAMAYDALVVKRVQRLRDEGRRRRSPARRAAQPR